MSKNSTLLQTLFACGNNEIDSCYFYLLYQVNATSTSQQKLSNHLHGSLDNFFKLGSILFDGCRLLFYQFLFGRFSLSLGVNRPYKSPFCETISTLFWTSFDVCGGIKFRVHTLTCVLCILKDSSDSPLVNVIMASDSLLAIDLFKHWWQWEPNSCPSVWQTDILDNLAIRVFFSYWVL